MARMLPMRAVKAPGAATARLAAPEEVAAADGLVVEDPEDPEEDEVEVDVELTPDT